MKTNDKFLIGIVVGVILLIVTAFVIAINRPIVSYQDDSTPEGVINNYLLALQTQDYEKAYSYLHPELENYPTSLDSFIQQVMANSWLFGQYDNQRVSFEDIKAKISNQRANVEVFRTVFSQSGLFSSNQYTDSITFSLRQDSAGQWKIISGSQYWVNCWENGTYNCK